MDQAPLSGLRTGFTVRHALALLGSGLLVASTLLFFLGVSVLLPPLAHDLGVGLGAVMIYVSLNFLAGAAMMTFGSLFLARRVGMRRLVLVGGIFAAAMLFLVGSVHSVWMLYLLGLLSGTVFLASTQMAAAELVETWFDQSRGLALGVMQAIGSLGGIAAGAALPRIVEDAGWRAGFRVVALTVAVIAMVVSLLLVRDRPQDVDLLPYGYLPPPVQIERRNLPGLAPEMARRSSRFLAGIAAVFVFNLVTVMQQQFAPLLDTKGIELTKAGALIAIFAVSNVIATLVLGELIDRRGAFQSALIAVGFAIVALLVFIFTRGAGPQLLAMLLFSLPAVVPPIMTPVIVREVVGQRGFDAVLGMGMAAMPLSVAVGSPLWGFSYDATGGYRLGLSIAIAVCVLAGALFTHALRQPR